MFSGRIVDFKKNTETSVPSKNYLKYYKYVFTTSINTIDYRIKIIKDQQLKKKCPAPAQAPPQAPA